MPAAQQITAHVVVEFAESDQVSAFVELDDRDNGLNAGKTQFLPGDTAYLLLFKPTGYSVSFSRPSSGTLVKHGDSIKSIGGEIVQFPNTDGSTVRYPISGSFTYEWLGDNLGVLSPASEFSVSLPPRTIDPGTQLPVPQYRVGIAEMGYDSECEVWKLYGVPSEVSQVLCFFVVRKDP
jgi:hypothetical protein